MGLPMPHVQLSPPHTTQSTRHTLTSATNQFLGRGTQHGAQANPNDSPVLCAMMRPMLSPMLTRVGRIIRTLYIFLSTLAKKTMPDSLQAPPIL